MGADKEGDLLSSWGEVLGGRCSILCLLNRSPASCRGEPRSLGLREGQWGCESENKNKLNTLNRVKNEQEKGTMWECFLMLAAGKACSRGLY